MMQQKKNSDVTPALAFSAPLSLVSASTFLSLPSAVIHRCPPNVPAIARTPASAQMGGSSRRCDVAAMDTMTHLTGMQIRAYMDEALHELAEPPFDALNGPCALRTLVTAVLSAHLLGISTSSLQAELAQPISSLIVPVWLSPRSQAQGRCLVAAVCKANEFANNPQKARRCATLGWIDARTLNVCESAWEGLRVGGVCGVAQRAVIGWAWSATTVASSEVETLGQDIYIEEGDGEKEEGVGEVVGWEVDGANISIVTAMLLDVRGVSDPVVE